MRIYKAKDYNDLSRKAANIISAQIIMKPDFSLHERMFQNMLIQWALKTLCRQKVSC